MPHFQVVPANVALVTFLKNDEMGFQRLIIASWFAVAVLTQTPKH